jgi:hypothetical protein
LPRDEDLIISSFRDIAAQRGREGEDQLWIRFLRVAGVFPGFDVPQNPDSK